MWLPRMQVNDGSEKVTLDRETYFESVIQKFSIQDSRSSKTPAESNFKFVKRSEDEQLVLRNVLQKYNWIAFIYREAKKAKLGFDTECALTIHGQVGKLPLVGWQTCSPLSLSHKVSITCVSKRQLLQPPAKSDTD